jgi:HAD superfamily hydrolase (TIGR01509 family)
MRPAATPIRTVLLDFDGTLVDSEANNLAADRRVLARFGIDFTEAGKRPYIGRAHLDMWVDLQRRYRLPATPEALVAEKDSACLELADPAGMVFPAMRRLVELARGRGLKLGVASGSSLVVVQALLRRARLDHHFATVVSAEEVAHGKPAPDVFLEAARRLGEPPQACVVVEDSPPGVEAALRASMRCIAIPSRIEPPLAPVLEQADLLFPRGMTSFDPEEALAWIEAQR